MLFCLSCFQVLPVIVPAGGEECLIKLRNQNLRHITVLKTKLNSPEKMVRYIMAMFVSACHAMSCNGCVSRRPWPQCFFSQPWVTKFGMRLNAAVDEFAKVGQTAMKNDPKIQRCLKPKILKHQAIGQVVTYIQKCANHGSVLQHFHPNKYLKKEAKSLYCWSSFEFLEFFNMRRPIGSKLSTYGVLRPCQTATRPDRHASWESKSFKNGPFVSSDSLSTQRLENSWSATCWQTGHLQQPHCSLPPWESVATSFDRFEGTGSLQ